MEILWSLVYSMKVDGIRPCVVMTEVDLMKCPFENSMRQASCRFPLYKISGCFRAHNWTYMALSLELSHQTLCKCLQASSMAIWGVSDCSGGCLKTFCFCGYTVSLVCTSQLCQHVHSCLISFFHCCNHFHVRCSIPQQRATLPPS